MSLQHIGHILCFMGQNCLSKSLQRDGCLLFHLQERQSLTGGNCSPALTVHLEEINYLSQAHGKNVYSAVGVTCHYRLRCCTFGSHSCQELVGSCHRGQGVATHLNQEGKSYHSHAVSAERHKRLTDDNGTPLAANNETINSNKRLQINSGSCLQCCRYG